MIEPKYQTLNGLFSDRVFRIPKYQRFYSWLKKQREDLFGDIRELAKKGEDRHHFMATIVCFRTHENLLALTSTERMTSWMANSG